MVDPQWTQVVMPSFAPSVRSPLWSFARPRALSPILLLWELRSRTGVIPEQTLAAPSTVAGTLYDLVVSGELISNLFISFLRVVAGLAIGVTVGGVLALTPLCVIWFGIRETPKTALITFASMFPVYLNLYAGIRGLGADWLVRTFENRALVWRPSIVEQ